MLLLGECWYERLLLTESSRSIFEGSACPTYCSREKRTADLCDTVLEYVNKLLDSDHLWRFEDGCVCGTAGLARDATTGPTPAVVGLLVPIGHRRQGIASALLDTVERLARDLGYDELFMNTSIPGDLVERRASQPGFSNRSIAG